jgi:uncharacterized protein GlcG (DUF336 family)
MTLSLAEASSIVDAAIIKARQLDVTVCVAVCDRLGSLIALNRMDGAYETINRYSVGKAVVSAGTGLPSGDVVGIVDHPPAATAVASGFPAIRIRGGLPIRRGGAVEGGCGVAGALSPEQDEECARAGIAAFNATTTVNERSSVATLASAPKTASAQESSMTDREIWAALKPLPTPTISNSNIKSTAKTPCSSIRSRASEFAGEAIYKSPALCSQAKNASKSGA